MLRVCRAALAVLVVAMVSLAAAPAAADSGAMLKVLVFTKTSDPEKVHSDTAEAVELLEMTGRRYGLDIQATDDASQFNPKRLAEFDTVVWLNTYGDVLDKTQQGAFEDWVGDGGGFVGVHSAAHTETDWAYFHDLVGAFETNGEDAPNSEKDITVNTGHPSTQGMPETWQDQSDQWYTFDRDPSELPNATVLATVTDNLTDDNPQPVAWCRDFEGGRSWYTSLGHSVKTFEDGDFMKLLRGGMWWTGGRDGQPIVQSTDAAPPWPYGLSFLAWVGAVAIGGAVVVIKLNRAEAVA